MSNTSLALSKYWELTDEQIELIKTAIARNATDDELALFIQTCKRMRLDPFARQIFLVKRYDRELGRNVATTQVSVDGYRLVAERTGEYRGQTPPEWCGPDEVWKQVWLDAKNPPVAARCGVYREGFREPLYRVALFRSYVQRTKEGAPTFMWRTYAEQMLHKCAESLALRAAFPNELSGVYTLEELPAEQSRVEGPLGDEKPAQQPAAKPRAVEPVRPRLTVVADAVPRTLKDFLAMGPKEQRVEEQRTITRAESLRRPEPELVVEGSVVFDGSTGEVWPLPEEDEEPELVAPTQLPKPQPKPEPKPAAVKRPAGSCPVWTQGDHKGKSYLDTPRKYLEACLNGPWAKNASSRQLEWAQHAVHVRTENARAEGRE